jgi:FkbM family methyltransferase
MQAIEFYNTFPNADIYAFECNPNTLDICKKNIEPYRDRITLIEGAVCDYDGNITFYPINQQKTITTWTDGNPGASSLFKSSGKYTTETYIQDEITTNCHRLDSIMKNYGIPKVDIIWMDLQGAELLALKGLGSYLSNVMYIHTEACMIEIYTNQSLFPEIHQYLSSMFCFDLINDVNTSQSFSDVIYKNRFIGDPLFSKIDLTLNEQMYIRGKPKMYLLHATELFKKHTNGKTILEIGSARNKMNHSITEFNPSCCNDGHSTYFWKHYTNADIYTVDIDSNCKYIIDNDITLKGVNSYTIDAFEFVKHFNEKIDLLFLDAWDVVPNCPYDVAHLNIYKELKYKLSDNCIIIIDDTDVGDGGKGKLLIPQLISDGFLMVINKRQTIFIKNHLLSADG